MKAYRTAGAVRTGIILVLALALRAATGEEPAAAAAERVDNPTPAKPSIAAPASVPAAKANAPLNTADILKLAEAGVSADVMKSFIETSPVVSKPSAKDLITLKEHGVADEVTLALLKRGVERPAQMTLSANEAARLLGSGGSNGGRGGRMDPESYDYFQQYYLFPRTLSWTYNQLGYYRSPYWGWGYWR